MARKKAEDRILETVRYMGRSCDAWIGGRAVLANYGDTFEVTPEEAEVLTRGEFERVSEPAPEPAPEPEKEGE